MVGTHPTIVWAQPTTSGTSIETGGNNDGQWGKTRAGEWDVTQNYKIGWIERWRLGQLHAHVPRGTYYVFAAQAYDGVSASQLAAASPL